jgi:hypothetical protein
MANIATKDSHRHNFVHRLAKTNSHIDS